MLRTPPADLLRCPATQQHLIFHSVDRLITEDGTRSYPVVEGVPILVVDGQGLFVASDIARRAKQGAAESRRRLTILRKVLERPASLNPGASARYESFALRVLAFTTTRPARVLVIGGAELGKGLRLLERTRSIELIETDVYVSDRVDVACDAHQLPFPDGVFDGVVAQAVLEHVMSPSRVVSELHRVLKPQGIIYAETPFMQQVHEGAFDFTRFTELGHRRLFDMFTEVDRGVAVGPATALVWSFRYFLRCLPRRSRFIGLALDKTANFGLAWFKYLDYFLNGHRGATDAAGGVYFVGLRSDERLTDKELLESYRGFGLGGSATKRGWADRVR